MKWRNEIQLDNLSVCRRLDFLDGSKDGPSRVVDEDIEPAETGHDLL